MRAVPQRPGPDGSRVTNKRPSIPRLGDGLRSLTSPTSGQTNGTMNSEPEVPTRLTSCNLNHFVSSMHVPGNFDWINASSVGSGDTVSVRLPSESICSDSLYDYSSEPGTPCDFDTTPTTLTGDDSCLSCDEEVIYDSSSSTTVDSRTYRRPTSLLPNIYLSRDATTKGQTLSPPKFLVSEKEMTFHFQYPPGRHPTRSSAELLGSVHGHATVDTALNAEYQYGRILRGIFATSTKTDSSPSSVAGSQQTASPIFAATERAKPFWNPVTIFHFYLRGAITPEKAKETAHSHGHAQVIPIIDEAETLKKQNPLLRIPDDITRVDNGGLPGILDVPMRISTFFYDFMSKFVAHSATDKLAESAKPLHVFVDMSNIHIGFCNSWKVSQNIPVDRHIRAPTFNFKVLAWIMERNRAAKKKFLASSVASHINSRAQWPRHFIDAEKQGYKTSIYKRVQRLSPVKAGRRCKTSAQGPSVINPNGPMTSGDESAEEPATAGYGTRNGEQGVDEILHLHMLESILDGMKEPGSMILATGDAAQAEFSDGFFQYANRALSQGWNLELVTWRAAISSAWKNSAFRSAYGERFRIIYLDDFLGELNADLWPELA
ncbi:hypothetical protein F4808DRAFT_455518 [Astrocystis sublimbata]|nr:hypothetical protein F4808DRAFT_455518 [Astrocystis sublimbata]